MQEDRLALFDQSWGAEYLPITVYTCDNVMDAAELSTFVLDSTGATHVFCFGADEAVHKAFNCRPDKSLQFVTFPFRRTSATATGTREYSKLCD